jgi:hypothetical protein
MRKVSPAAAVARYRSADRSAGIATITSSSEVSYVQPLSSTISTRRGRSDAGSGAAITRSVACSIRPLRLPAYTSSPNRITTRLSAITWSSPRRCEETTTVRPPAANDFSSSRISTMPAGSSPFIGSSSTSNSGSGSNAAAIPSRCFIPSE